MANRKIFDLFYGARERDEDMYKSAYAAGADINFQFDGKRATKGGGGRWYYGDLHWYAPDGINGDKGDTLLMIAIKTNYRELAEWILTLDKVEVNVKNSKGLDVMSIAKDLGREDILVHFAPKSTKGTDAQNDAESRCVSVGGSADPEAISLNLTMIDENSRLENSVKMLKAKLDEKDNEMNNLEAEVEMYKQKIKEKDSIMGELKATVLKKEKEMTVMMHKIGQLEEALSEYTDFRQEHADQFVAWGKAQMHKNGI
ncbi:unnamed protein product [Discosporangium mesarthrocarpum]